MYLETILIGRMITLDYKLIVLYFTVTCIPINKYLLCISILQIYERRSIFLIKSVHGEDVMNNA